MSRRVGIIGHPVAHSLSPVFQAAAFAHAGLDVTYELWDATAEDLPARVASLRDPSCLGANVTIPHKQAVIPLVDELGGHSARVGAVNTIVNREGRLFGFNTDGPGFVRALRDEAGFEPSGASFLLLGAGGAARGIAFALLEAPAAHVAILNRTAARARRLVAGLQSARAALADPSAPLSGYDCIVNCTSVGMEGTGTEGDLPCSFPSERKPRLAVDIVYAPERTAFLAAAEAAGIATLGGLPMLIYQGALAFEHWTGIAAPVDVMFDAARAELRRRATQEMRA